MDNEFVMPMVLLVDTSESMPMVRSRNIPAKMIGRLQIRADMDWDL